jgi:hypothetical protein
VAASASADLLGSPLDAPTPASSTGRGSSAGWLTGSKSGPVRASAGGSSASGASTPNLLDMEDFDATALSLSPSLAPAEPVPVPEPPVPAPAPSRSATATPVVREDPAATLPQGAFRAVVLSIPYLESFFDTRLPQTFFLTKGAWRVWAIVHETLTSHGRQRRSSAWTMRRVKCKGWKPRRCGCQPRPPRARFADDLGGGRTQDLSGSALSTLLSDGQTPLERAPSRTLPMVAPTNLLENRCVGMRAPMRTAWARANATRARFRLAAGRAAAATPIRLSSSIDFGADDDEESLPVFLKARTSQGSQPKAAAPSTASTVGTVSRVPASAPAPPPASSSSSAVVLADMDRLLTEIDWDAPGSATGPATATATASASAVAAATPFSMMGRCSSCAD